MSAVVLDAPGGSPGAVAAADAAGTLQVPTVVPSRRYPLNVVRALAAMSVLAFHAYQNNQTDAGWPWTGVPHSLMMATDLAVDLFFVISGFLLWMPVSRAMRAGRPQRPGRQMLRRRAVRLLPLYYLVLLVAWSLANPVLPGYWQDLVLHLTMTQVYSDTYIFWTIGPAWTLALEFHAYLLVAALMPAMTWLTLRLPSVRARMAVLAGVPAVLGVLGVGYLTWAIAIAHKANDDWSVWFGFPAKAHFFALGMGLAVIASTGATLPRWGRRLVLGLCGLTVLVGVVLRDDLSSDWVKWGHVIFGLVCAGWVAAIVLNRNDQPRWLGWRPLAYVGTVSYSLYLVHELTMQKLRAAGVFPEIGTTAGVVVTAVVTFAVALLVAGLSYRFLERPLAAMVDGMERADETYEGTGSQPVRLEDESVGTAGRS